MGSEGPVRRRRSRAVSLGLTGVLAAGGLAACGSGDDDGEEDYRGVCVDERTQQRVDDDECDDDGVRAGGFGWYYLPLGARAVGLGQRVSGGTARPPARAAVVRGGVPADGGTIARGGLGGGSDSSVGG
ncbi:tRNA-dihydrouridine synthase [Kineococcus sp. SYSU DK005]|uniref:tRNA-dihydrouridine synthase n=1 Tax=Kineococcus sp. SYSU DK005 TaxID=3383126 RepID=UPI003D7C6297